MCSDTRKFLKEGNFEKGTENTEKEACGLSKNVKKNVSEL